MKERLRQIARVGSRTAELWHDVEGFRLGAAFSFYATFAIFPLLLLTVTAIGFVIGDSDPARLLDVVASRESPLRHVLESTVVTMQESRSVRGLSAAVGIATLLFSASGAFVELDTAINRIWGVRPPRSQTIWETVRDYLRDRLAGLAIVGAIAVVSFASLAVNAGLAGIAERAPSRLTPALLRAAEPVASVFLLSMVFTAAFHLVPRQRPRFRDVIGGAILTATMLAILKTLVASWLSRVTSYSAYGIAGGVLAVAMWIYLSSQIIFLGACVTRCAATEGRPAPPGGGHALRSAA